LIIKIQEMEIAGKDLLEMYRWMVKIRLFEETCLSLYRSGEKLADFINPCIGQEAITVGSCFCLNDGDIIHPSLRGRGQLLMKGISIREMMAGILGKSTACNKGRMPIRHIGDLDRGILLGSCIIGSGIAVSVGVALALTLKKTDHVVLCFFGDGATSEGIFYESLNFAAIHRLPIIFICENNLFAYTTPIEQQMAIRKISERAKGLGFQGLTIDGNDLIKVHKVSKMVIDRARKGEGPTLIECNTYRLGPHTAWDQDTYRTQEEKEKGSKKCPIEKLRKNLLREGILTIEQDMEIRNAIHSEIEEAIISARKDPDPKWQELFEYLYAT
jgi:TPP-dependent pyruvate/acetoin dehydrogenase alpha subunit